MLGTDQGFQRVGYTPSRTRVEVLREVSADGRLARRLQREEDAEADTRERADFEFAKFLNMKGDAGDGGGESDGSDSEYGVGEGL